MGDRVLSSVAGGNSARPMRLPDPSPMLDKNRAPMGPEILSSTGAGVWRKAPMAFPDSSSVLDKLQTAKKGKNRFRPPPERNSEKVGILAQKQAFAAYIFPIFRSFFPFFLGEAESCSFPYFGPEAFQGLSWLWGS